jgi:hypothetical protein
MGKYHYELGQGDAKERGSEDSRTTAEYQE